MKWRKIILALASAFLMLIPISHTINASQPTNQTTSQTTNQNNQKTLSSPYVVYGSGVPQSVYSNLNQIFQVQPNFKKLIVNANDYRQYINPASYGTTNAAMISSVALAPTDPGSGINVNIKNYQGKNNILQVTAQQYAMVAQMAGVTDVNIIVTANEPVSGTSALTGVYKALAADGLNVNTQNTSAANKMISATQPAINDNQHDSQYPGKLMAAIGQVSKQLAEMKQQNNQLATKQQIQQMLNQALAKEGILQQTKPQYIIQIVNSLNLFQQAPVASSKSYVQTVDNTINNVKQSSGNLMNKAKSWFHSPKVQSETQQASTKAQSWFERFINWLKRLFGMS